MPHGGYKQSGYGKDLSVYSLEDYTQIKHVMAKIDWTETRLLIGGEQVAGEGEPLPVENPYREETIASVALPSPEQVDAAIASAREAACEQGTPAIERGSPCTRRPRESVVEPASWRS